MNKTLTINLSGIVFHIDENAYEAFNAYIESIRKHFASSEGKDEIMQDIESRIAEMFQQRVGESKQVITIHDVDEVTAAMGKPEQFGDDEPGTTEEVPHTGIKRRLFRNSEDEVLGGVCSGIGAYFGIDHVWIRLAFVLALIFFGSGILLYIILWIVIPEAKTTADKLMMRGESVTVSNIEKNVREEFDEFKKKVENASSGIKQKITSRDYSGFTGFLRRFVDGLGELLGFIFKAIGKIFAFFFILIGLAVFIVCMLAFLTVAGISVVKFPVVALSFFTTSGLLFWALTAFLLLVGIPFLLLFYYGFRILFNIKHKTKAVNMTAGGLWLAGLFIAIITGVSIAKKYSDKATVRQELNIMQPTGDTLFVSMKTNSMDMEDEDTDLFNGWYVQSDTGTTIIGPVRVDIKRSTSDNYELAKVVYSRGESRRKANENAGGVMLSYTQTDNKLILDNHFQVTKNTGFGFQNVKYVIGLPVGKMIHISKDMGESLYDVQNVTDMFDYYMAGHTWKMTENGLTCLDCSSEESSPHDEASINIGGGDDG
ncbi:MAG: PspC domain-containing protein, partial [Bacteroidia bacterium]|nr:PspC domain-containing protein [Bacteroidia bacterium]